MVIDIGLQSLYALLYYAALIVIVRLAGKRLGGQITTFDLVVLIQLAVVLQTTAFQEGFANAAVWVVTVLVAHRVLAMACARSTRLRRFVRGAPRPLIRNGKVSAEALDEEGLSYEELLAGLRKQGHESPSDVKLAVLEETGQISVIAKD
jgi:uncharacterized membrane protein YcaP (DUF421 family)